MPSAWIGLLADRGNTTVPGSPIDHVTSPAGSTPTTTPRWRLSTSPDRTTSARTSTSATVSGGPMTAPRAAPLALISVLFARSSPILVRLVGPAGPLPHQQGWPHE